LERLCGDRRTGGGADFQDLGVQAVHGGSTQHVLAPQVAPHLARDGQLLAHRCIKPNGLADGDVRGL
jgi:hypothetical protein